MAQTGAVADLAALAIAVPILLACVLLAVGRRLPRLAIDAVALASAAGILGVDIALFVGTGTGRVVSWVGGWTPRHGHSVGIVLVVDRTGSGFAVLAAVLTLVAVAFSWRYYDSVEASFHALLLLFLAGMTGFVLTGDLFDMFVFFELMGAAAYALTGFKVEDSRAVQGALNFGVVNSFGAYFTLTGVGLLYARTGQLGLAQIGGALEGHHRDALVVVGFVLIITGWLVKAAVVPFHFWLDDAHAVAPTPVCVLLSGVMVELGLYGVLRVYWTAFAGAIPADDVRRALIVVGTVTALVGAVMCLAQRHLKRLLAFSTIAHVGLFLCAFGTLDASGTTGAVVYILGHAGAKSALFLLAGVVLNRYRSVDEIDLHGRGREARVTGVLFVVAALALAGLPPFGTALGKAVGEDALSKQGYWFGPVLFVVVSALTGGAVLRAGGRIFFGLGRPAHRQQGPTTEGEEQPEIGGRLRGLPITMGGPVVALILGSLAVGAVPAVAHAFGRAATRFVDQAGYRGQVLHGAAPGPAPIPAGVDWTASGVALGALSCLLAAAVAGIALYGSTRQDRLGAARAPFAAGIGVLRQLHSGHVGDYVTWLFLGIGALTALVGLPLLR